MFVDRPRPIAGHTLIRTGDEPSDGRSQRGLGRDLAAILENSLAREAPAVGLTQLLGERRPATPSVRRFVVDVALAAIAEAFEADAIVLARCRSGGDLPVVSSRLPPSWDDELGVKFELIGHVWDLLRDVSKPHHQPSQHRVIAIDGLHAWLGAHWSGEGRLAAAIARRTPLTDREQVALARIVRSVACAVDDEPTPLPHGARLSVSLTTATRSADSGSDADSAADVRAIVALRGGGERRTAAAEAPSADLAVANAAVELAGASRSVSVGFAGRVAIDDMSVSIVVLEDPDDAPLLGLVVADRSCRAGLAEAVFAALAV